MSTKPFSVITDNPFVIVQHLQKIAPPDAIDLSRGDPGLGFAPSKRGRELAAAVIALDAFFNRGTRKIPSSLGDLRNPLRRICSVEHAKNVEKLLQEFIQGIIKAAKGEGKTWDDGEVLRQLFSLSTMAGGSYLYPLGEEITRTVVAELHRRETGISFSSEDVLLTAGASHAMGTLFKLFSSTGYLKRGDVIAMTSPAYWPNRGFAEELGLRVLNVSVNIQTGEIETKSLRKLSNADKAPKVLFLIDPHNPTGFKLREGDLTCIAEIVRRIDAVVVSEELYFPFTLSLSPFDAAQGDPEESNGSKGSSPVSICSLCPERTIRVHARSKSERATGLRFGEIVMTAEARETLQRRLKLSSVEALMQAFRNAKAPGFSAGQFQHTTFVPGPSQLLGIAHLILGGEEREQFVATVNENRKVFCERLALSHREGTYYLVFDLAQITQSGRPRRSPKGEDGWAESLLINLAKAGVIYLPAAKFFEEGKVPPSVVRASVANAPREKILEAAEITRQVLRT